MKKQVLLTIITAFLSQTSFAAPMDRIGGPEGTMQTIHHCGYLPTGNKLYTSSRTTTHLIETKLSAMGYRAKVDGNYGKKDKRAVKQFQRDYGLKVDGIVGPITAQKLGFISHPSAHVRRCQRMASGN